MQEIFPISQINGDQPTQGSIAIGTYTGKSLTGNLGVTADTVDGTATGVGCHAAIYLNAAGLVTLFDTDGMTVLGVGTADPGTHTITTSPLAEGEHVLTTTVTIGDAVSPPSAPVVIDVDTQPPSTRFDATVTVEGPRRATLWGTGADPGGVGAVNVAVPGRDLGDAAVSGDGTWSLSFTARRSFGTGIEATGVDAAGNQVPAPSSYDLDFGIKGQPYGITEDSSDPKTEAYEGTTVFEADGEDLYRDTDAARPKGNSAYTYTAGTFFDDKAHSAFEDVYNAGWDIRFQEQHNTDGTVATLGQADGITVPNIPDNTITANGEGDRFVFTPRAGRPPSPTSRRPARGTTSSPWWRHPVSPLAEVMRHITLMGGDAIIHFNPTSSIGLAGTSKYQ